MKTTKRTIELTVEKSEKFLVRRWKTIYARCSECEAEVKMLSPEAAAETVSFTPRAIYRLVESNQIHFTETVEGHLLVCLDSLFQREQLK